MKCIAYVTVVLSTLLVCGMAGAAVNPCAGTNVSPEIVTGLFSSERPIPSLTKSQRSLGVMVASGLTGAWKKRCRKTCPGVSWRLKNGRCCQFGSRFTKRCRPPRIKCKRRPW